MSLEDDIISQMREGYNKSNIVKQDLLQKDNDPVSHVANLFLLSRPKNREGSTMQFDPVQIEILRKTVSPQIIEKKVRVIKEEFFRTAIYLDFFCSYVVGDTAILDDWHKKRKELEKIDPFLDPNLELAVRSSSFEYMKNYSEVARNDGRKNNYRNSREEINGRYNFLKFRDPFTAAAAGYYVSEFKNEEVKKRIPAVKSITDANALLFVDINLDFCKREYDQKYQKIEQEALSMIDAADYFGAAHHSMKSAALKASRKPMAEYIATMKPTEYRVRE